MFRLSSFYQLLICCRFINVWFVVGLLRRGVVRRLIMNFYICKSDSDRQKTYLINRMYQIMIISILKNCNCKYYSRYFIKFIGFMLIYYAINLYIVLSYIVFSYLHI